MANANFTCVLDAWRDGRTLYGRMHYYRSGSYYYYDASFPNPTMDLGGTVFTDTDFGNRVRSGIYVGDVYSTTFSRTIADSGNKTVTWSAGSGVRSDFAGSWSQTVYFPEEYTPPTGLAVSIAEIYPTGAKFNVSISSYGNPSSANNRYIEAAILNQNTYGSVYRFAVARNTLSSAITVNNSSAGGTLTIQPNKQYYYGAYASNTQLSTSKVQGTFVTLANAPTLSVLTAGDTEASILYSGTSDAGKYEKTLEYSIDGGLTWTTYATISSGDAYIGSFIISGLTKKSTYVLKNRVSTTSGTTDGEDIVFRTSQPSTKDKLYGSVANEAELIVDLYGSVQNTSERITKLYGSNNDSSKLTYQGFGHINYT